MVTVKVVRTPLGFREYLVIDGALLDLRDLLSELLTNHQLYKPRKVIKACDQRTGNIIPLALVEYATSSALC